MLKKEVTNADLLKQFNKMEKRFDESDKRFDSVDKRHSELMEFLYENMVTKDDLNREINSVRVDLGREIATVRNELVTHIDHFIHNHQTHDIELTAHQSRFRRLETRVDTIEKKVGI